MTELILLGTIISLCALIGYMINQNRKERSKLINALISKSALEAAQLDMADKVDVKVDKPQPDLIPESELSLDEWEKMVL